MIQGDIRETSKIYRRSNEKLQNVVTQTTETKDHITEIASESENAFEAVEEMAKIAKNKLQSHRIYWS